MVDSRQKGARFERNVAKALSLWWGAAFHRTPQSGGSQLASAMNLCGDVCTDDPSFPFHVECKHVEAWSLDQITSTPLSALVQAWMTQAETDNAKAATPKAWHLLAITKNRADTYVLLWPSVTIGQTPLRYTVFRRRLYTALAQLPAFAAMCTVVRKDKATRAALLTTLDALVKVEKPR